MELSVKVCNKANIMQGIETGTFFVSHITNDKCETMIYESFYKHETILWDILKTSIFLWVLLQTQNKNKVY